MSIEIVIKGDALGSLRELGAVIKFSGVVFHSSSLRRKHFAYISAGIGPESPSSIPPMMASSLLTDVAM
jgi:hypothetical protein